MGCRISTDGDQTKTRFPAPLPVFFFICEHLCHLWIKIPSPFVSARCSSVVWAVSAHPCPISSNLRDSILTYFQ